MNGIRAQIDDIRHTCRMKIYPDGSRHILVAERPIFREPGWELADKSANSKPARRADAEAWIEAAEATAEADGSAALAAGSDSLERSKRRARVAVRDYGLCNDFKYFVTLTLDPIYINRYDIKEVTRKLNTWADNAVRRQGLKYVLVPELHKDGAIHFHGFFNDALEAKDSGTMIPPGGGKPKRPRSKAQRAAWAAAGGHIVYNLPAWKLGYTTAIPLYGRRAAAVGYVCKYISKAQTKVGGRWYYSGGGLARPELTFSDVPIEAYERAEAAFSFVIEDLGVRCLSIMDERKIHIAEDEKAQHLEPPM